MLDTMIRIGDIWFALIGTALLIFLIYLIVLIKNLIDTVKAVQQIIDENKDHIDGVLREAPSIARHVESISGDVAHDVKAVQSTIDNVLGTAEVASETLVENIDVVAHFIGFMKAIYMLKEIFADGKKKRRFF